MLEHAADEIKILGFSDMDQTRANEFSEKYGGKAYTSLDEVLADDQVELVVNLTIHHAHYEVLKKCLEAGKHAYTEKPITLEYAQAKELVELAESKGLILAGAPVTFMGDAQQTAWKTIRDGKIGKVRLIYAENNHGRIESWHPNPGPFYAVGPLWDTGVYPLTLATTFFGPAKRVATSYQRVIFPDRTTKEGVDFHIETPEFTTAVIELESGPIVRLTSNFYVHGNNTHQKGRFEVHGDKGSTIIGNFQSSQAEVESSDFGENLEIVEPLQDPPFQNIPFYRGVQEVAQALRENRPCRVTGAQAAHIVEILEAVSESAKRGEPVELTSTFAPPEPMDWAK
jgi:predicted dehydrogenase